MPPKRVPKGKLHQLAVELPQKTILTDISTKKQYSVGKQFATGGFGRIYTCNEVGSKTELVVKVEPFGNGPLFTEVNVFIRILKPDQISQFMKSRKLKRLGLPPLISSGVFTHGNDRLRFLVMPKYATSLEAIREKMKKLPVQDVWTVVRCMLESLEYIHEKSYTHADIKAANILLEKVGDFSSSVLVDFGLARMASNNEDKPDKKRAHNGTAPFTSCDAHSGRHPSFRGDLEILAYNVIYWLSGSLPWEAFEADPAKIYAMKMEFLKDLPSNLKKLLKDNPESVAALVEMFSVAKKTSYTEQLDFSKLFKVVDDLLKRITSGPRKRPSDDNGDVVDVKKTKASGRNKGTATSEAQTNGKEEENDITVDGVIEQTARQVRFRKKVGASACPSPTAVVIKRQSPRIAAGFNGECSSSALSSSPQPSLPRRNANGGARIRHHAVRPASIHVRSSSRRLARLSSGEVIPGLSVTRAPPISVNSVSEEVTGTPSGKNGTKPSGISSGDKRSPSKLRKIPGMLNFARGRRSIVIDQITKKYQRIAQKKRSSGEHVID
ncbi:hypothetical protein OESDEN_04144 [Oesophagostomum dentatum]|uniref:non-specific serine/threonine protein kinase n=1 Tax=Oesophagostomum dentatum TaxID=61180 RepID=A0A0B1TF52_OESDE|nr:hypothetical protein OESDEN_04144 [Oesophagostomum dentatum]